MQTAKRFIVWIGAGLTVAVACLIGGPANSAYASDGTKISEVRHVQGRTIISTERPRAKFSIAKGYRFVGAQQINLYGLAEADQCIFARLGRNNAVKSFYWIQFEHFLPSNDRTYSYKADRTTRVGDLDFVYNVGSWPDYGAVVMSDPASDGAGIGRLLEKQHLSLPKRAAHVRMFHSPSADHRSELMIIYGEALPENSPIPVGDAGTDLDTESPASARTLLEHARHSITIHRQ